jgi:hypothetical protein
MQALVNLQQQLGDTAYLVPGSTGSATPQTLNHDGQPCAAQLEDTAYMLPGVLCLYTLLNY